jgi:hypothetical protein
MTVNPMQSAHDAPRCKAKSKRTEQRSPAATWRRRRGQNVMVDQRAIGRFLGNGIRPVMGRSSAKADARVLGALLKIASAAFW